MFLRLRGGDVSEKNNKMKIFIDSNPGIASRISHIINFESYDPYIDMPEILKGLADNLGYTLCEDTLSLATDFFVIRSTYEDFGNGREARRLLQNVIKHQSVRLQDEISYTREDLQQLTKIDMVFAVNELLKSATELEGRPKNKIGF